MRMLKNSFVVGLLLVFGLTLTACSAEKPAAPSKHAKAAAVAKSSSAGENETSKEKALKMKIKVGDKVFAAKLYDNETSRALLARLPITVDMTRAAWTGKIL